MTAPIRLELERRFPVSVHDGFHYITDPGHWPEHWPGLVRIDCAPRWRRPGDRARLVLRVLHRERELDMKLEQIEPYRLIQNTSRLRGLPVARHWRRVDEIDDEVVYRLAVQHQPRSGWRSLFDQLVETMINLERRFRERSSSRRC